MLLRLTTLIATVAMAGGLSGCAMLDQGIPEPEDLSCLWVNDEDGSSFELGGYGDFTYWNRPGSAGNEGNWIYGDGTDIRDSTGNWQITLNFTEPHAEAWLLRVSGSGDGMTLYEWKGDPDQHYNRYEFRRAECK